MRYNHFDMLPDRAFLKVGGKIMPQGGGGSPTQSSQTASTIPEYAQPYVMPTLGQGQALTDINQNPYQPYKGQMLANFSPMQVQGMSSIANQQVAPQITDASNLSYQSGTGGLGAYQNAARLQNAALDYGAAGAQGAFANADLINAYGGEAFKSGQLGQQLGIAGGAKFGNMGAAAGQLGQDIGTAGGAYYGGQGMNYGAQGANLAGANLGVGALGMQAGMGYGQGAQNAGTVQGYMNPYLQASLQPQLTEMQRQYGISGAQGQSNATKAGAFGGSREALMFAENQRNKNIAMNQAIGQGYNTAYDVANRNMQAASSLGMQGAQVGLAGLSGANQNYLTGLQGVNAGLQGVNTQLAGTAQGMQGAQVGLAGVDRQLAGTSQGMQGASLGMQGANQAGQLMLGGAGVGLQGVQGAVGAGQYGLAGLGQANAAAGTLGNLGQTQYAQQQAIAQAQMQVGAQQQALQQKGLDTAYNQYQQQLQYPYQQLSFMQGLYTGLPMQNQAQTMYQNPSAVSQAAGLGTAAMGAYGMYKMAQKEGGLTKSMADGGITQLFDVGGSIKTDLSRMSPQDLQEYIAESSSPTAKRMAQQLLAEKTAIARMQQNPGVTQLPSNLPVGEAMAGGGIVAFAEGDRVESSDSSGDTRADADLILARLIAGANEENNIRPIPGSEMAQATTNDASPVAIPVAAPAPITGAVIPPQAVGVDSLVARPPTRLPAVGAAPAAPVNPATSMYGGIPIMSPEAREEFSQYSKLYKDLRSDTPKAREEAKWMAIMQAGLGIAGGTSPNALANISQGAMPAMAQYQAAIKDIRKDDREALKGLVDLGLKKEEFIQRAEKMGIDKYTADKVFEAHKYSADATVRAAQARAASEKTHKPTDQETAVNDYVAAARLDPANKGKSDEQLRVEGRIQYLVYSRPQQPNASIATAITGREKEDNILLGLEMDRWRNRSNPAKLKEIDADIKERKEFLAGVVKGESSSGRGLDAEVPGVPNASAEASAAAKWAKVPVPPVPKEVPIAPDKWAMAVGKLRLDPSPTNKKYFDAQFGEGASDRALKK
jgi:hypothetical protein